MFFVCSPFVFASFFLFCLFYFVSWLVKGKGKISLLLIVYVASTKQPCGSSSEQLECWSKTFFQIYCHWHRVQGCCVSIAMPGHKRLKVETKEEPVTDPVIKDEHEDETWQEPNGRKWIGVQQQVRRPPLQVRQTSLHCLSKMRLIQSKRKKRKNLGLIRWKRKNVKMMD